MPRVFFQVFIGVSREGAGAAAFIVLYLTLGGKWTSADDITFFCSSLDFGRKTDVMTFIEPVLLLLSENISRPAGMALNCAPSPFKSPGTPLLGNAQDLS